MLKTTKPRQTVAFLERKLLEAVAQTPLTLSSSILNLKKAGEPMMASAVVVHLTALGGREILPPFAIYDGLSEATVKALVDDLSRTLTRVRC